MNRAKMCLGGCNGGGMKEKGVSRAALSTQNAPTVTPVRLCLASAQNTNNHPTKNGSIEGPVPPPLSLPLANPLSHLTSFLLLHT